MIGYWYEKQEIHLHYILKFVGDLNLGPVEAFRATHNYLNVVGLLMATEFLKLYRIHILAIVDTDSIVPGVRGEGAEGGAGRGEGRGGRERGAAGGIRLVHICTDDVYEIGTTPWYSAYQF